MPVKRAKGDKGACDELCSLIVRARRVCERCGESDYSKLAAAHIVRRRYSAVRTDTQNLWCLCWSCHDRVDNHADEFMSLVADTVGIDAYSALKARAEIPTRMDWKSERARLKALLEAVVVCEGESR